jgi:hypothetical protein
LDFRVGIVKTLVSFMVIITIVIMVVSIIILRVVVIIVIHTCKHCHNKINSKLRFVFIIIYCASKQLFTCVP